MLNVGLVENDTNIVHDFYRQHGNGIQDVLAQQQHQTAYAQQMGLQNCRDPYNQLQAAGYGAGGVGGAAIPTPYKTCDKSPEPIHNYSVKDPVYSKPKETKVSDSNMLPDISLSRVFKWALVVLIGLALGERVWAKIGPQLLDGLHKAIGAISGDKVLPPVPPA
jgi:hypothetical protein